MNRGTDTPVLYNGGNVAASDRETVDLYVTAFSLCRVQQEQMVSYEEEDNSQLKRSKSYADMQKSDPIQVHFTLKELKYALQSASTKFV